VGRGQSDHAIASPGKLVQVWLGDTGISQGLGREEREAGSRRAGLVNRLPGPYIGLSMIREPFDRRRAHHGEEDLDID
jgi:hypothetical protein